MQTVALQARAHGCLASRARAASRRASPPCAPPPGAQPEAFRHNDTAWRAALLPPRRRARASTVSRRATALHVATVTAELVAQLSAAAVSPWLNLAALAAVFWTLFSQGGELRRDVKELRRGQALTRRDIKQLRRGQTSMGVSLGFLTEVYVRERVAQLAGKPFARSVQLRTAADLVSLVLGDGAGGELATAEPEQTAVSRLVAVLAEQHQGFCAWLHALRARLLSAGVAAAAAVDVGPDLPPASFPAAVAALRSAAVAHYYAPAKRGGGDDDEEEGDDAGDEGGERWWVDACNVLSEYAEAVAPPSGAAAAADARLPAAAQRVLLLHAVSFATSLVLGEQRTVLEIDCVGRFRMWVAPGAPQTGAVAEIKTSAAGWRAARKQLADRFRVLAFVYDAVYAPLAAPRLRAVGTVYAPSLAGGTSVASGGSAVECLTVASQSPGGGGTRTVLIDFEVRRAAFAS